MTFRILGHRLWEEGSYYYLTEKGMMKKLVDSLEPSLGLNFRNTLEEDSEKSPIRSLVAQTSTESSTASMEHRVQTAVNNSEDANHEAPISPVSPVWDAAEAETPALTSLIDGTIVNTATEATADQSLADVLVQDESPVEKSEKKRFESGTTSIFGNASWTC